jgi:TolB-like protein
MMKLLAELKRRQMFRVAAAYAVVAWLLLQIVNNVAPVLDLPVWVARAFLLALVIGFPIALLFVWMRELAPADAAAPRAATTKLDYVLAGGLILVIALLSYQQLAPTNAVRTEASVAASGVPATGGISIAVLPFANMSGDASQEFFSDGITEEINAALTKVPDLDVVARTSAFEFKGQNRNVRAVGEALGATHLIEGSVRKAGNRVRITAQLVRADNGLNLWSENYDRELTDIFSIQEQIAQAIAVALRVPLGLQPGDSLVRSRTKDEASYEDYLRARALMRARGGDALVGVADGTRGLARLTEATKLLESVVARDPDFAPAHALLAYGHGLVPVFHPAYTSGTVEEVRSVVAANFPKAETAARRAIELDSKTADGHMALGLVQAHQGKYVAASELFARALALDPENPDTLHVYSGILADLGYVKQAIALRQRLAELEPLVTIFRLSSVRIVQAGGQIDAAIAMYPAPRDGGSVIVARMYAEIGRYNEAADLVERAPRATRSGSDALQVRGADNAEAAARLLRTARTAAASPQTLPRLGELGWVYLYVGAPDRVLEWYEDTLRAGYRGAQIVRLWGPPYAGLRKTERFKAFVREAGFVDYWRAKGWPDLCRPVRADDFVCE